MSNQEEAQVINDPVTRETLYALVWAEPTLKVAARFSVSSSYLARICTLLNVPRPERGYWAKLTFGKAPPVPGLPDARPGDELAWSRDGQSYLAKPPRAPSPRKHSRRKLQRTVALPDEHGLISGIATHFEAGRVSSEIGYLKPDKRLLVDVVVTQASRSKALSFANELFLALEADEHRVILAPSAEHFHREAPDPREDPKAYAGYNEVWSPARPTVVYIGTLKRAFQLAVFVSRRTRRIPEQSGPSNSAKTRTRIFQRKFRQSFETCRRLLPKSFAWLRSQSRKPRRNVIDGTPCNKHGDEKKPKNGLQRR